MITENKKIQFHQIGSNNNKSIVDAAKIGDLESVKYLMTTEFENYFNRVSDSAKQSAFVMACGGGHLDVVKYFLKRDNKRSLSLKRTAPQALRQAIQEDKVEMARYLLNTLEVKKHIDIAANTIFYFNLAPLNMLQYLVFEYKMDLNPYIEKLRNHEYVLRDKRYALDLLDYYELQQEIGTNNVKEKKIKI